MGFRFGRRKENKPPRERRSLNDIFLTHKQKLLDLHKRYLVIRIDPDFFRDFFSSYHHAIGLVVFFLVITMASIFSGFVRADVATFYPSTCLGGWQHPENVQGGPSLPPDAPASDFNLINSAFMQQSSGEIYCGGFKGNVPANTKPTRFRISLLLSVDDGSVKHLEPEPLDGSIPTTSTPASDTTPAPAPTTTDTTPQAITSPSTTDQPSVSPPQSSTTPSDGTSPPQTPTPDTTPTPPSPTPVDTQPQSYLDNLFTKTALAQDNTDATTTILTPTATPAPDPTPTSDTSAKQDIPPTPAPPTSDQFLEVDYTLDGTTWNTLGNLSRASWKNNSFDIPLTEWTSLDNLQISIKTLSTFDDPSVVYLDAMALSVDYDNIAKLVEPPTVILKDSANVISSDKTDFSSEEQPTFTITNPNIDTNGIKVLIDENKAEVVSDPNGALGKPTIAPAEPATSPPTTPTPTPPSDAPVSTHYVPKLMDKLFSFFSFKTRIAEAADPSSVKNNISASVLDVEGNTVNIPAVVETVAVNGIEQQQVKVQKPKREFRPGHYKLKISMNTSQATIISTQDFTWGVLAINMNKSVYRSGDDAYIQMGVLNDAGHTICNADLNLDITSPSGVVTHFTTDDNSIIRAKECGPDNVIDVPDYYTHFKIGADVGTYNLKLTANTVNGTKNINDSFTVSADNSFVLQRTGPTRIYPIATYPMTIHVTSDTDWDGVVSEKVPSSFVISEPDNSTVYDKVETIGDTTIISWNVSLVAGVETVLGYHFNAPDISPEFYLLGPAQMVDKSKTLSFEETRNWQIASDAACTASATGNWNAAATWGNVCNGGGANGFPGATATGDTAVINANVVVTYTANTAFSVASISFNNPAATGANKLIVNTSTTLTVTGDIGFVANTGTLNQTLQLNGTAIVNAGSLTMNNVPTSSGSALVDSATGVCTSCQLNVTGATSLTNATTAVAGAAEITMTTGATNVFSTGTLSITGNTTGTGITTVSTATGTITINGATTFAGVAGKTLLNVTGAGTLNLFGNLPTGGTVTLAVTSTTNTKATLSVNAYTFGILKIITGTTTTTGAVTVNGTLTVSDGTTFKLGNFAYTQNGAATIGGGTSGIMNASAGSTGTQTFGAITVSAGGNFDLSASNAVNSFGGTVTNNSANVMKFATGNNSFNGIGTWIWAGSGSINFGAGTMTILTNVTVSNTSTGTATIGALTISSPTGANGFTAGTGSTTTITNAITFNANTTANNQTITLSGTAIMNAGSLNMGNVPTSTGSALVVTNGGTVCSSCQLNVTGLTTLANATTAVAGAAKIQMTTGATNIFRTGTLTYSTNSTGTGVATLSTLTGTITIGGAVTFTGTNPALMLLTTTGAAQINLNGSTIPTGGTLTLAAGTKLTTTGTSAVNLTSANYGLVTVTNGTFTMGAALTATGVTISNTATLAAGANLLTDTGNLTCGSGGSATLSGSSGVTVSGASSVISGGTCTISNTGTFTISGATAPSMSAGATYTFSSTVRLSGNITFTNNGTVNGVSFSEIAGPANWANASGSTLNFSGSFTVTNLTPATASNTIIYSGTAQTVHAPTTNPYWNLSFSGTGTNNVTLPASVTTLSGNLALSGTSAVTTGANITNIAGTLTVGDGTTLTLGAFSLTITGNTTIGGGTSGVFNATNGTAVTLNGDLTLNAGSTWTKMTSGNVTFSKGAAQQITDSTASTQDLGTVVTATASTSVSSMTNLKFTSLNIAGSTTFDISNDTVTFTGTGITPLTISGTFTIPSSTVVYTGATATVTATTFNNLTLGGTGTYTLPATNMTLRGNLVIASGTTAVTKGAGTILFATGGGGTQTLTDNLATKQDLGSIQVSANAGNSTLTLGSNIKATNITIDASQILDVTTTPFNITLNGNWTNNGSTAGFNARAGTVTLATNATSTLSGTTTFNNFSVSGIGAAKTLTFLHQTANSPIFTFAGTVTLAGSAGNLITINSDSSGTQWLAHFNSSQSSSFVSVKDSGCDAGSSIISTDVNSILGTNNGYCWNPTITFLNSDSTIGFGTFSSSFVTYANGTANGSITDVIAHTFTITTSAVNGYSLSYIGPTLTSGANTISPATGIGTAGTAGVSQFAMSGTLTGTGTGAMATNYNHATPKWTYAANTTTTLANSTAPVKSDVIDMHYEANISAATGSGAYNTTITYLLTGNF